MNIFCYLRLVARLAASNLHPSSAATERLRTEETGNNRTLFYVYGRLEARRESCDGVWETESARCDRPGDI